MTHDFYKEDQELGKELVDSYLNIFNDRIPALFPKDVKVAHKIGTQVGVYNDVGIVYADNPYIIAIMTNNINENEAAKVIANISKKVYDSIGSL